VVDEIGGPRCAAYADFHDGRTIDGHGVGKLAHECRAGIDIRSGQGFEDTRS